MSPPPSQSASAENGMREMARRPRDSDGVGNALRQIFGGASGGMPADFRSLLNHLNKGD